MDSPERVTGPRGRRDRRVTSGNEGVERAEHVSLKEAGRMLGVSRWTVRRMVEADELLATEVRGMLKVVTADVDRYIAEHNHNGRQ